MANPTDDPTKTAPDFNGPPAPWSEDRPDAEERVRLYDPDPAIGFITVPLEHVEGAMKAGAVPAWDKTKPPQLWAPWESALAGIGQGALLGHEDEAYGAMGAAAQAASDRSLEGFGEHYKQNRDDARQRLEQAHNQNPKSFTGGQMVGTGATALAAPGGLPAALALGAIQGEGNSDVEDVGGLAKDAAIGTVGGAAGYGAGKVLGAGLKAAAPYVKNVAAKALLRGAGIGPRDLGATSEEAVNIGKAALDEPGLVPPVLSWQTANAENLAANSAKSAENAGRRLGKVHDTFDAAHGPTVSARGLAEEIRDATAASALAKPSLSRHLHEALRQIDPEKFAAFEESLVQRVAKARDLLKSLKAGAAEDPTITPAHLAQAEKSVLRAKDALKAFGKDPSHAYAEDHVLSHAQVQGVLNRINNFGTHAGKASEIPLSVKEAVLKPAWATGASAIRNSAAAFGGEEALAAENAAREHYGNMIDFKKGAEVAAQRAAAAPKPTEGLAGMGKAAILHAVKPELGALALAGQVAKPLVGSRSAAIVNNVANALPKVGEKTADLLGSHGALFASTPKERRVHLDHKLQELSPRYREKRRAAEKEVQERKP